jgi:DNA-binding transcriptional MerR regulator
MKLYHISELEQISGIKAPTIRVWERRYNLIEPGRTDTNIRMYDDRQVRKLLNVVTLLANGSKISKIAELDESDLHRMVMEIQAKKEGDSVAIAYVNDLVAAMLEFDETGFEKTFSAAVDRYGMSDAMLKVFYPLLHKIGIMWATEDAMPVQEHFASSVLRRKLMAAADALPVPKKKTKKILLMLPPGEWHEIGLLFANYLIRSKGMPTVYLGQNVPYENVSAVLKKTTITQVLLFFIARPDSANLKQLRRQMGLTPDITLLVAGNAQVTDEISREKNTVVLLSPQHLLKYLG